MRRVWVGLGLWLGVAVACTAGAQEFTTVQAGAQLRDAILLPEHGVVLCAAYDRGQVWKVDLATHERLSFGVVGSGPVSLALDASGDVIACVNRLDHSVTLLRTSDLQPIATVPCGEGASDVAWLDSGRFAVTNSFADSVTLIDPVSPERTDAIEGIASVPTAIAALDRGAVVATQSPPALVVIAGGDVSRTIPLSSPAQSLAHLGGSRVAVATDTGAVVVDASDGSILATRVGSYRDLAASDEDLYALQDGRIEVLTRDLDLQSSVSVSADARAVEARGGAMAVLSPAAKTWHVAGVVAPTQIVEDAPAPAEPVRDVAVASEAPVVREAAPAADEGVPVVREAEPVIETPEPVSVEGELVEEAPQPPPMQTAEQAAPEQPQPPRQDRKIRAPIRQPSPIPASAFEVRAPTTSRRPSPLPSFESPEITLSEGIEQPELGTDGGGFVPPDWTNVLADLDADRQSWTYGEGEQRLEAYGNVNLQLEDTLFKSQVFKFNESTGEFYAEGDVHITQRASSLDADSVQYFVTPREEVAPLSPLQAAVEDEQTQERKRLTLGRVTAENVHVIEPTREIEASHVDYDFSTESGEIVDAYGRAGIYYFGADHVRVLGPASFDAEDIWVTTCDLPTPHYRIRLSQASMRDGKAMRGSDARLQLGKANTPVYWPRWRFGVGGGPGIGFDFDSGRTAELGYYLNVAQWFPIAPDANIGLRFFPTEKEGVGFGIDGTYDYMDNPASPLFRAKGSLESLYSTEDREFIHWYNRYDLADDTIMLNQIEHWGDREVYKDYYYDRFRDRSEPRSFTNITYTRPTYIASGTVRLSPNNWVRETERFPEVAFNLLERQLFEHIYFTYDGVLGYNERNPAGTHATRLVNVARLSLDLDLHEALSFTPFLEAEGTWYSDGRDDEVGSISRFSSVAGVTAQTRFHRSFPGFWGFSEFKHVIVPSFTVSYRNEPTVEIDEVPRFDAYDNVYGRTRFETKIDNIILGRDAETDETWQVARLSLYQGNDFWNEFRQSDDYEMEMDLRPRPWWGFQGALERHLIENDFDLDRPFFLERLGLELYEEVFGKPLDREAAYQFNAQYSDYNRILAFLYYDGTPLGKNYNGRIGFAYTATDDDVFNREILYGAGYKFNELWAVAFEHRYDFERDELSRQTYEIRRALHCWEMALQFRDRESGWDIGVEFNIRAFPGSKVKF